MTLNRTERLLTILTGTFTAIVLISTIASSKMTALGPFIFDAGTILFPLSYVIASVLTEVYGLKRAELVIVTGLLTQILASLTFMAVGGLPVYEGWAGQDAFMTILGVVPRIALASIVAYAIGEFLNVRLLSYLQDRLSNRMLRMGIVLLLSQLVDTVIFSTLAFAGTMPFTDLMTLIGTVFFIKTVVILLFTPLSSTLIARVKAAVKAA